MPPWMVSSAAAGSQRTSGASTRRLLTTSRFAVTLLDELKVPLAAVLPTRSWAKSAVVALRVLAAATVTFRFRLMPPSAKEASRAPSSLRTVTRAFWICRSPSNNRRIFAGSSRCPGWAGRRGASGTAGSG